MGLFLDINWVRELGYKDVIFELDVKFVVDAFNSKNVFIFEFGSLLKVCKTHFSPFSIGTLMLSLLGRILTRLLIPMVALLTASSHEYSDVWETNTCVRETNTCVDFLAKRVLPPQQGV